MKAKHPTIIISFVPGGCTGLWQPLDVGIQRVLKQSMKCSAHQDIVLETTTQLDSGTSANSLKLDTTLGTLCNQSVGWLVAVYHNINNKDLILKVFILIIDVVHSYVMITDRHSRCAMLVISTSHRKA